MLWLLTGFSLLPSATSSAKALALFLGWKYFQDTQSCYTASYVIVSRYSVTVGTERQQTVEHFSWSTSETATWRMTVLDLSFTCSPWYYCFRPAVSLGSSLFSLNPILPSALSSPFHFAASRRLHSFLLTKYHEKAQEKQLFLPVTAELIFLMICK